MGNGIIEWKGDYGRPDGNYSRSKVEGVTTDGALTTLQGVLAEHSRCNVAKRIFLTSTIVNDEAPVSDPLANVDIKGVVYYRQANNSHTRRIEIPMPVEDDIVAVPGSPGDRYTQEALIAIVSAIATATGLTLTPLWGKRIERS